MKELNQMKIIKAVAVTLCFLGILFAIGWALGRTTNILIAAFALAYLVHPLLLFLERKKIRRGTTVTIVFFLVTALVTGFLFVLIPRLIEEISDLSQQLPAIAGRIQAKVESLFSQWNLPVSFEIEEIRKYVISHVQEILSEYSKPALTSLGSLFSGAFSLFVWILNLALFPIFFFYLIHDYEKILNFVNSLVPPNHRPLVKSYVTKANQILAGYIRGQLTVCVCLAGIYSVGYSLIGVPFGFLLGCIAGALSFIPYVGASCGSVGALLLVAGSGGEANLYLGVLLIFALAQTLESYVLTPKLIGNRVGLSPLATILGIIAGANTAGFLGMIIAIPTTAILRIIAIDLVEAYKKKF